MGEMQLNRVIESMYGFIFLLVCFFCSAQGVKEYSVDVCFLVADLKYNAQQGVKICEIQQACLSVFNGDVVCNVEEESIHKELARTLSLYNKKGWVVANGIADKNI